MGRLIHQLCVVQILSVPWCITRGVTDVEVFVLFSCELTHAGGWLLYGGYLCAGVEGVFPTITCFAILCS